MSAVIAYKDSKIADKAVEGSLRVSLKESQARTAQLERSISQFIAKVSAVTFNVDEDEQESWMSNWQRHLANGSINAIDDAPDDQ